MPFVLVVQFSTQNLHMKNQFSVSGNVGRAEIKNDGKLLTFSVAENIFKYNPETKQQEEAGTSWWNCTLWINNPDYRKFAEHIVQKGKPVAVEGTLQQREYEGKTYYDVRVDRVFPDVSNRKAK
jgi:single-stranded DNA-binding protein